MPTARSLTGGTGDLKPQQMNINMSQSAADTLTQQRFQTPVPRNLTSRAGKATVMEILQVHFYPLANNTNPAEADSSIICALGTTTLPSTGGTALNNAACFAGFAIRELITTSGVIAIDSPIKIDMTDGAGNGFLVATDSLSMVIASAATTVAVNVCAKILYRMTDVPLPEYIGIVQSQQNPVSST